MQNTTFFYKSHIKLASLPEFLGADFTFLLFVGLEGGHDKLIGVVGTLTKRSFKLRKELFTAIEFWETEVIFSKGSDLNQLQLF